MVGDEIFIGIVSTLFLIIKFNYIHQLFLLNTALNITQFKTKHGNLGD